MKVQNRIKKYKEFQDVINEGKFLCVDSFNVYFKQNSLKYARIGISIPKKSGNAVIRNKMKRQIRAAIAQEFNFNLSLDIVLIARKLFNIDNFSKTKTDIIELVKKVG